MKLICFIDLFNENARIYSWSEADDTQTFLSRTPVATLSENLATISNISGVNHITLIGAPVFAEALVPEIIEYAKTRYSNNELIVEVMQ